MTSAEWVAVLGLAVVIMQLLNVTMQAFVLFYSRRTEKNTNSMKDALVASTAKASHAEGVVEGKAERAR